MNVFLLQHSYISYSPDSQVCSLHRCYSPGCRLSYQVQEVLTLSLYCSVLWAACLWSCSVSRSLLHPSWKKQPREDTMKWNHKETVMFWRDCWGLFWGEEEKEEERLSHTQSQKQRRGREYPVREGGSTTSVREKPKVCYSCTETDCLN